MRLGNWTDVEASGVKYMRVGGISYDAHNNSGTSITHTWTATELANGPFSIIAEIRSHGIGIGIGEITHM